MGNPHSVSSPCYFSLPPPRFEKNDILRVVRALAIFRPSLIALQMPLSFDDEVFVEKCFQRSLLVRFCGLINLINLTATLRRRGRSSTSSSPSAGRRRSCGGARARSASSHPSSACSPSGRWTSSSGGKNTSTRCVLLTYSFVSIVNKRTVSCLRTNQSWSTGRTLRRTRLRTRRSRCTRTACCSSQTARRCRRRSASRYGGICSTCPASL